MALPVTPPVAPMLAKLARTIPDDHLYEPKVDGLRCVVFRDGEAIDMQSRNGRPLARYFPELTEGVAHLAAPRVVLDGELIIVRPDGFDFEALLARLHPAASRVARLAEETPAMFVSFDVLALGDRDLFATPFAERREVLEKVMSDRPDLLGVTRITDDRSRATDWLARFTGGGVDGIVAKHRELRYEPGVRAMVKVKTRRSALCVAAGFRVYEETLLPSSILLGLYDGERLAHIGIASGFGRERSAQLLNDLRPSIVPIDGHPWQHGFGPPRSSLGRLRGAASRWNPDEMDLDWIPLREGLVCEATYEQADRRRLRHPARFAGWRSDVDARACTIDQLDSPAVDPSELLA